jgi:hypothetical protein
MSKQLFTILPEDFMSAGRRPVFHGALTIMDLPAAHRDALCANGL